MNLPVHFLLTILSIFETVSCVSFRKASTPAIFMGDSETDRWRKAGAPVWDKYYKPIPALNLGVGGDKTTDTIKLIKSGVLDNLKGTKVVVLLIGGNDIAQGAKPSKVAKNIKTIISMIQDKLPKARILLLGLLPAGVPSLIVKRGRSVNRKIAKYDDGDMVRFLNMRYSFEKKDGEPNFELYDSDKIHLNVKGYQVWADTMNPLFQELLTHP